MSERSITPDYTALEIPMDAWSEPFWAAGAEGRLIMPRCGDCGTFRWPAGPFCASCQSQVVEWVPPGQARIYSFTVLAVPTGEDVSVRRRIAALVAFDEAPGVRLISALVDAEIDRVAIDVPVEVQWNKAANAQVPVFKLLPVG